MTDLMPPIRRTSVSHLFRAIVLTVALAALAVVATMIVLQVTDVGATGWGILGAAFAIALVWFLTGVVWPRLPRAQYSLRFLLIATALVGMCLGLIAARVARVREERAIAARWEKRGGFCSVNGLTPDWINRRFHLHRNKYFQVVDEAHFDNGEIGYEAIPDLAGLQLRNFTVFRGQFTDRHLEQLARYFPDLQSLRIQHERISDDGLKSLAKLKELRKLEFWGAPITNEGVAHLRSLKSMETLRLNKTEVDDDVIPLLRQFPRLRGLDLSYCQITDAAINDLSKMKQLEVLNLIDVPITAEGANRLKAALPLCDILWQAAPKPPPAPEYPSSTP